MQWLKKFELITGASRGLGGEIAKALPRSPGANAAAGEDRCAAAACRFGQREGGSRSRRTKNNDPCFHVNDGEQNEGLRPRILWTQLPDNFNS